MAARVLSSAILRSALATHVSLSATSLLCSAFGPSQFESSPTSSNSQEQHQSSSPPCHRDVMGNANVCAALPWLDRLHNTIAGMYVGGGVNNRRRALRQNDVMVQISEDVSFENPVVSYAGVEETERAFRGRLLLHYQNDIKTVLECINVEASEDSICGGESLSLDQQHSEQGVTSSSPSSLVAVPSTTNISSSPPKVEVTYRLSQKYGTFFTVNSLLVVTVRVRRGSSPKIRRISTNRKVAVPLATSGFAQRAACTAAAATTSHAAPATLALAKAAGEMVAATARGPRRPGADGHGAPQHTAPLVAEVVRIEERWNGVQLLRFAPFHWSRRLNGLVAGCAAFLFFH